MIDFSNINKLLDKIQFYVLIDFKNENDVLLIQEMITKLNNEWKEKYKLDKIEEKKKSINKLFSIF